MFLLKALALLSVSVLASAAPQSSSSPSSTIALGSSASTTTRSSPSSSSSSKSSPSSSSSSSSSTSTLSSAAATKTVSVGADGLSYSPKPLTANVGDIIEPSTSNHVFPTKITGAGKVGFWSGFEPTAIVSNNPSIYNLLINDTEPIFFYCSSPGACFEGMIGVINPNATQTLDVQLAYAGNATIEFSPNEYFPKEVDSNRPAPSSNSSSHKSLSGGAIAGIVIGGVAVLALVAAVIYMCGRHQTMKELFKRPTPAPPNDNNMNHNSYMSEAQYANRLSPGLGLDTVSGGMSPYRGAYTHTETDSFRSKSPPLDDVGMQLIRNGQYQNVHSGSPMYSPGYPSPEYSYEAHMAGHNPHSPSLPEMENRRVTEALRLSQKAEQSRGLGPIELPVSMRIPSMTTGPSSPDERPFSYTDSEIGYAGMKRDVKQGSVTPV